MMAINQAGKKGLGVWDSIGNYEVMAIWWDTCMIYIYICVCICIYIYIHTYMLPQWDRCSQLNLTTAHVGAGHAISSGWSPCATGVDCGHSPGENQGSVPTIPPFHRKREVNIWVGRHLYEPRMFLEILLRSPS